MYNILKLIIYKLWMAAAVTLFCTVIVLWWFGTLVAFAVLTLGISGIFYNAQDLLLYYPNDPPDSREFILQPSNYKLPYESIKIKNKDGLLIHMYFIKQESNSRYVPTLMFLHGNAGNMGQRLSNVTGLYHKLNINILMVEYRGYGLSEGTPSESGLYNDAQSALEYLLNRSDIDVKKIILFGRSLGGAVAIDLASCKQFKTSVWALVVENTFTSIPDMADIILKWRCLKWMPKMLHKNKYLSIQKVNNIVTPTLVICGSEDSLVPPAMGKALYMKCNAIRKKLIIINGGGHNDTWTCRDYYSSIQQFLLDVPPLSSNIEPFYDNESDCSPSIIESNPVHIV